MFIKGQRITILNGYEMTESVEKQIKELMANHRYNTKINWESVRYQMKKKKTS